MVELIIDASNSTFTKKSHMAGSPIGDHVYGISGPSLLIESTDYDYCYNFLKLKVHVQVYGLLCFADFSTEIKFCVGNSAVHSSFVSQHINVSIHTIV